VIRRGLLCLLLLCASPVLPQAVQGQAANPHDEKPQTEIPEAVATPSDTAGFSEQQMQVECTPTSRAATMIGHHGCVAGRVFRVTTNHRGDIRLSLCPNRHRCSFTAVVRGRDKDSVGELWHLRGKVVAIVGDITEFRDEPRIIVEHKDQIQIAAEDVPQEFDAAQPRAVGRGRRHGVQSAW
jgi:hypothetical protein